VQSEENKWADNDGKKIRRLPNYWNSKWRREKQNPFAN
jgi:hypothetical protein